MKALSSESYLRIRYLIIGVIYKVFKQIYFAEFIYILS